MSFCDLLYICWSDSLYISIMTFQEHRTDVNAEEVSGDIYDISA